MAAFTSDKVDFGEKNITRNKKESFYKDKGASVSRI